MTGSPDARAAGPDGRPAAAAAAAVAPLVTYHAGRAKRRRGVYMILGALLVPGFLYWRGADFDMSDTADTVFLGAILVALLVIVAVGIERLFEPQPTLAATEAGVVLFPARRAPGVLGWAEIDAVEVFPIATPFGERRFVTFVVADPDLIARHLSPVQRVAFRIDRAWLGENRYLRSQSDFDRPVDEVVAELSGLRERLR